MPPASRPPGPGPSPRSVAPRVFGFLSARIRSLSSSPGSRGGTAKSPVDDAQPVEEAPQRPQILVGHLRRREHADLLGPVAAERGGEGAEGLVPGRLHHLPVRSDGGRGEAGVVVDPVEAVAAGVAEPPLIDLGIEARLEPRHPLALVVVGALLVGVDLDVAPARAAVADALGGVEVPHPHLEAEVAVGERAHRADVDDVARVGVLQRRAGEEADLGVVAALEDAQLAGAGDLVAEPHAARAEDAALGVQDDVGPQRHRLGLVDLLVGHARVVEPVLHVVDLQPALPRLVAHRTVQGMVDEVELHHGPPRVLHPRRLRLHHHALRHHACCRRSAGAAPCRCPPCRGGTGRRCSEPG